jgi:hypothetical protein
LLRIRIVSYYGPSAGSIDAEQSKILMELADGICQGRIPFLSYETQDLGLSPAWNKDFISGKEWPVGTSSSLPVVRFDGSDIKVPWELSRLQFLPILGKAYYLTKKTKYRKAALHFISDWIRKNPVGRGVNWVVAMEVALRALSILLLLALLHPFVDEEREWLNEVTQSLWQHLVYIEGNLEFSHIVRGNHYLSNLLGLYALSVFLEAPGFPQRRRRYKRLLEREISFHTYPDGGNYEASSGYHVLVTQIFLTAYQLMLADGATVRHSFTERLSKMFDWIEAIADGSCRLPHIGDCDDGRTEFLPDDLKQMTLQLQGRDSLRVGSLVSFGKSILQRNTKHACGDAGGVYVSPKRPPAAATGSSGFNCTVLPDSGIAIARSKEADLLFLAVPNGIGGKGTHTHNDKLSVIFRINGEEVLCDLGTGCYTRDGEMRNYFRSTVAHNTIVVDDEEQNRIPKGRNGFFSMGNEARVSRIERTLTATSCRFNASHFGYTDRKIVHTRSVEWKQSGCIQIEDGLSGGAAHNLGIYFHFGPTWKLASLIQNENGIAGVLEGGRRIHINVTASEKALAEIVPANISWVYGTVVPSSALRVQVVAELPTSISTTLSWEE